MVVEKIRQAELQRVKEDIAKQTGRPLNASDVHARATDKFDQITCPVVFRRMVPGRKPELHLRVTQEIARRIEQLHFGTAMAGKTIDVVFLIPKGLMKRAEPVPQDVEEN